MLRDTQAFSGFSVDDIEAAKRFYAETLGLDVTDGDGNLSIALPGGGTVFLYPKPNHEPATFTVLNFRSNDFDADRAQLRDSGVEFERYDMPGLKTDPDGVMRGQGPEIAWFKDPAGNVLSLIKA
jgi:catechol 2,3-dioxygenase-like lactoylglutathione lyase family enzyme